VSENVFYLPFHHSETWPDWWSGKAKKKIKKPMGRTGGVEKPPSTPKKIIMGRTNSPAFPT
jgi:hypothetical protein